MAAETGVIDWRCERCGKPAKTITIDRARAIDVLHERSRCDAERAGKAIDAVDLIAEYGADEHSGRRLGWPRPTGST